MNRISKLVRCVAPIVAGIPFLAFAAIGVGSVGPHPLALGLGLVGLLGVAAGSYYGLWRIEYHERGFTVYPGKKNYTVEEIVSWQLREDTDAELGHRRHLELRFGPWYRRYILFEEDVAPHAFRTLLEILRRRQETERTEEPRVGRPVVGELRSGAHHDS